MCCRCGSTAETFPTYFLGVSYQLCDDCDNKRLDLALQQQAIMKQFLESKINEGK